MRFRRSRPVIFSQPPPLTFTFWVKWVLLANAAVFIASRFTPPGAVADALGFWPSRVFPQAWGMVTYMFVHQTWGHWLVNSLFIFFFGPGLERRWGSNVFIKFYLLCGLGGVLLSFAFSDSGLVGASAACYGMMVAFAMIWPNAPVYVWGILPVRMKWLVFFAVPFAFVSNFDSDDDNVAHLAHLGGAAAGAVLMYSGLLPGTPRSRTPARDWGPGAHRWASGAASWKPPGGRRSDAGGSGDGSGGWRIGAKPSSRRSSARGGSGWRSGAVPGGSGPAGPRRAPSAPRPENIGRVKYAWLWARAWVRVLRRVAAARKAAAAEKSDPDSQRPRIVRVHRPASDADRAARERAELDEVDDVLDKISERGINSLTAEERDLLDRVSRQTRAN